MHQKIATHYKPGIPNYLGDNAVTLRSLGVRGSIEMAAIAERLDRNDEEEKKRASLAVGIVAKRLQFTDDEALALIRTLKEDGQVDLVWELYTQEIPLRRNNQLGIRRKKENERGDKSSKTKKKAP